MQLRASVAIRLFVSFLICVSWWVPHAVHPQQAEAAEDCSESALTQGACQSSCPYPAYTIIGSPENDACMACVQVEGSDCRDRNAKAAAAEAAQKKAAEQHSARPATFQQLLDEGLIKANLSEACKKLGSCQITDMIQIVLNVMTFILGISGSVFLLMFVYGGFLWLTSAGDSGKFRQGRDTLRDAILGLVVILSAYTIVNTVLSLISTGSLPTKGLDTTLNGITEVKTIELKQN